MRESRANADPWAHLKKRAQERGRRTVERTRGAILRLRARGEKVTADSLKQSSRELEPGFAGLSFQVLRRNPAAYELYCEAADAFATRVPVKTTSRTKRLRAATRGRQQIPRAKYDPLEGRSKKELVRRVRSLEVTLEAERQLRADLGYDKQTLLARLLRTETDNVLLRAERTHNDR